MNLEEQLMNYKKMLQTEPQEEKIQETVCKSREVFLVSEQEGVLSYFEFLMTQMKVIQKRWWFFQLLLLLGLWTLLAFEHEPWYVQRSMGVIASLFVILIIPELWKNRSCHSMEIEAVSYYSLRQIYAARMLLFGIMDILLITFFCQAASVGLHYELTQLMVQFLFPLSVTACICFGTLCSKYAFSETVAIAMCIMWSTVWLFIILNESVYVMLTFPMWCSLWGFVCICLAIAVYRTLKCCNQYWEVTFDGIEV